jgi:hypothetical protein
MKGPIIHMLLTSVALFVCAPSFAQTAAPAASIPDLSGVWGRNWFNFEPPSSGAGPVLPKLRRPNGTLITNPAVGDYSNPILRPQAVETVKNRGEMELSGVVPPNPGNQCWPEPTPYTLSHQQGVQIIQQKDQVILIYLRDHKVRHVRINAARSEHPTATWQGESIGHYEGDTLVIDTIGQKIGPLSMVDLYGTPFSPALHVIERYRLIDGATARDLQQTHESAYFGAGASNPVPNEYGMEIDPDSLKPGLRVEVTVDDPATFTTPWSAFVTYRHVLGDYWPEGAEGVCAENTRGAGSEWISLVPRADKPDF